MKPNGQRTPREILAEDHRAIERVLDRLIATVRAGDREDARRAWSRLERPLLAHLDVEEMFVFPALAAAHPDEVAGLRREHDGLRREIGALGLAFELDTLRADDIESLCALLRAHSAREEALAYEAAERSTSADVASAISHRLEGHVERRDAEAPANRSPGVRGASPVEAGASHNGGNTS